MMEQILEVINIIVCLCVAVVGIRGICECRAMIKRIEELRDRHGRIMSTPPVQSFEVNKVISVDDPRFLEMQKLAQKVLNEDFEYYA